MEESDLLIAKERSYNKTAKVDKDVFNRIFKLLLIVLIIIGLYFGYDYFFGNTHYDKVKKQQLVDLKLDLENYVEKQKKMPSKRIKYWKKEFLESEYNRSAKNNPTNNKKYNFEVVFTNNMKNNVVCKMSEDCENTIFVDPGFACSKDGVKKEADNVAFRTVLSDKSIYCLNYKK